MIMTQHCFGACYSSKCLYCVQIVHLLLLATLLGSSVIQVECLNFGYPNFTKQNEVDFITTENAYISFNAIQVTSLAGDLISNLSGRIWYRHPFKLWSRRKNITASFNSTFVLSLIPQTHPWGEGLAFILTKEIGYIPENSQGQWLGVVNSSTNGSTQSNVVAIEFDTRKSFSEDIDDNHVGVDVNSIYSIEQASLYGHGVILPSGQDITARVQYDGELKTLAIFVFMSNATGNNNSSPIISMPLDLSKYLSEYVYLGFSASTGQYTEVNCIKAWNFTSTDIDDPVHLLWMYLAIVIPIALIIGFFFFLCWRRKTNEKQIQEDPMVVLQIKDSATAPQKFRLKELKCATGNFDPKNMLGKGGCGIVYKGLLSNKEVAVKRFSKDSSQGKPDFIAEITTIGNLHHKNLVKLFGWCYESNELLLVYEFMPNGSLDKHIFSSNFQDKGGSSSTLSWERRHTIICGVARVLDYLHNGCEKRVLHRDIKASNIMLDSDFNARLGDFGLARTIRVGGETHHSTKVIAGTPGYMAPESFHVGRATVETDVYAFGVLLLEIACGRKPGNHRIIDWVWELYKMEKITKAMDVRLKGDFEEEQAVYVLKLGLACCHPNPYQRPSMRIALQVLTGEVAPPPIPSEKPAFMWPANTPSSNEHLGNTLTGGQLTPITTLSGR
ncbi:unnamed protein product [Ilex paraguariensis]|uniref:Protein kinase domain-containing protein n=1 Tax=Ilex paraguariensis TaxID=185542 RepID=A0ABC8RU75_9AQUA